MDSNKFQHVELIGIKNRRGVEVEGNGETLPFHVKAGNMLASFPVDSSCLAYSLAQEIPNERMNT